MKKILLKSSYVGSVDLPTWRIASKWPAWVSSWSRPTDLALTFPMSPMTANRGDQLEPEAIAVNVNRLLHALLYPQW